QFALPIEIEAGETCRESSGLALSWRNGYLSEAERAKAVELSATLRAMAKQYREALATLAEIEVRAMDSLRAAGWQPDYLTIRRRDDLGVPSGRSDSLVALGAAKLGNTRLIDNVEF
ncbi:MAG: 4-phosphopantoate--beta-alanine ligase, partial [Betaproteobacteria bacterium]